MITGETWTKNFIIFHGANQKWYMQGSSELQKEFIGNRTSQLPVRGGWAPGMGWVEACLSVGINGTQLSLRQHYGMGRHGGGQFGIWMDSKQKQITWFNKSALIPTAFPPNFTEEIAVGKRLVSTNSIVVHILRGDYILAPCQSWLQRWAQNI